jgi:hypothetical protein
VRMLSLQCKATETRSQVDRGGTAKLANSGRIRWLKRVSKHDLSCSTMYLALE